MSSSYKTEEFGAEMVCATEIEEFFYVDTDDPVPEGEFVGLDIDIGKEVKFVLFKIYTGTLNINKL